MRTRQARRYDHGFVLTEQELRRLVDLMHQQLGRAVPVSTSVASSFTLRYRTGAMADPSTLEEVLALENFASTAIERLSIEVGDDLDRDAKTNTLIRLSFTDCGLSDPGKNDEAPIRFSVVGNERDWVFVTSSLLEERIGKLRRLNSAGLTESKVVTSMIPLLSMLAGVYGSTYISRRAGPNAFQAIRNKYESGGYGTDLGQLVIDIEASRVAQYSGWVYFGSMIGMMIAMYAVGYGVAYSLQYIWPPYNFCWGDYAEQFQKREARNRVAGSVVLGGVVLATLVGILTNYLSHALGVG